MDVSPSRTTLYRRTACAVILPGLALLGLLTTAAQVSRGAKADKGPRALGLLAMPANGKPRLIPVAIMVDGQFYDASAYKASPVPMALWSEVVYEAEKTGVSQGLFTVTSALQNTQTSGWMAEGKWQTTADLAAAAKKQAAPPSKPRGLDDESGPPVLRHAGASKPAAPEPATAQTSTSQTTPAQTGIPPAAPPATPQPSGSVSTSQTAPASPAAAPPAAVATTVPVAADTSRSASEPEDPNRPALKRGKPQEKPEQPENSDLGSPPSGKSAQSPGKTPPSSSPQASQIQLIPAISDADGPEPRSYAFVLKAGEEEEFRKKVVALATDAIRAREKQATTGTTVALVHPAPRGKPAGKSPQPDFKDVQLRVFDLSNSNDATLVLTAKAESVQHTSSGETVAREYFVAVVAREDLNGDLHKVFASVTDAQHLDVPRWELIDAVDANGDGSGELLFRKISDAGSAFAIYRVIGDQLYPLFEGTPGE